MTTWFAGMYDDECEEDEKIQIIIDAVHRRGAEEHAQQLADRLRREAEFMANPRACLMGT